MINSKPKLCFFSSNVLKTIAALSMLIDHIGYLILPEYRILRIIGRLAFPIFSFMIAEGCNYTKNKLRYFLTILILAVVCQIAYYSFDGRLDMGILVTFSLSILVIYALQNLKEELFSAKSSPGKKCFAAILLLLTVETVYLLNIYLDIDYGFWGCIAPVFASVFRQTKTNMPDSFKKLDCITVHVTMLGIGLIIISLALGGIQYYSLLALLPLLLYSGKRGKRKMKLFFYIFYPAHLVVLQCIEMMI